MFILRALFTLFWLTTTFIIAQSAILGQVDLHCDQYFEWKQYVLKNCDEDTGFMSMLCDDKLKLLKGINLNWNKCENRSGRSDEESFSKLKVLYAKWEEIYAYCHEWYNSEKKAADSCSSQSSHRVHTWEAEIWPTYCEDIFKKYEKERKNIESTCARTSYSDRFWEGYAEFVASPLCKKFYDTIRQIAYLHECHERNQMYSEKCTNIFSWYTEKKAKIERDCFEIDLARGFYDAFYKWRETHY